MESSFSTYRIWEVFLSILLDSTQAIFYLVLSVYIKNESRIESKFINPSLKPENVLVDGDGYARITDFGLSKENIDE